MNVIRVIVPISVFYCIWEMSYALYNQVISPNSGKVHNSQHVVFSPMEMVQLFMIHEGTLERSTDASLFAGVVIQLAPPLSAHNA